MPAAAAGAAYLNARTSLWYDVLMIRSIVPALLTTGWMRRQGRISIFYRFEQNALSSPSANRTFLLYEDRSYTYKDAYNQALRYGCWLKEKMGVQKGDMVAINAMNSDTFIFLWMGLWSIGATPAFINYNLRDHALAHCVKTANSKLMIVDPAVADAITPEIRSQVPGTRIEILTVDIGAEIDATEAIRYPDEQRYDTNPASVAILIFTSGTTGMPKAAVVSWSKMIRSGNFAFTWMGLRKDDVYYTVCSLSKHVPTGQTAF